MNAEISETIRGRLLRLGVQIPELLTQIAQHPLDEKKALYY